MLDLYQQRNLLDANAVRYLAEQRWVADKRDTQGATGGAPWYSRMHIQHFTWAWHSETQIQLLQQLERSYRIPMQWATARHLGVFVWLRSQESLRAFAEEVARGQYNSGDERDPTLCSLLYYALGKHRLVANLWRQAIWHPDQKKMLHFLKNDFSEKRWKTAAMKNAFALLSQRRFGKSRLRKTQHLACAH